MSADPFAFDEDERACAEAARRVAAEVLAPRAAALDAEERFPHEGLAELARLGFMGANLPQAYGGVDASSVAVSSSPSPLRPSPAPPASGPRRRRPSPRTPTTTGTSCLRSRCGRSSRRTRTTRPWTT